MDQVTFGGAAKSIRGHNVSIRDYAAYTLVHRTIEEAGVDGPIIAPTPMSIPDPSLPIAIIGSGATGLYAAMILQDLGVNYRILEANSRVGGRLYTYRFNGEAGRTAPVNTPARYDYFDIGAMRYPRIPFMKRVFDLFKRLEMEHLLVKYELDNDNALSAYNGRPPAKRAQVSSEPDYFRVSVKNHGTVPDAFADEPASHWTDKAYDDYKALFAKLEDVPVDQRQEEFAKAWDFLTTQDHHSTRGYMLSGAEGKPANAPIHYPNTVVDWLETFDSATGLYDQSFVESVLDSLDFGWPNPSVTPAPPPAQKSKSIQEDEWKWVCIDGGSDHIVTEMVSRLNHKPQINERVTHISQSEKNTMLVTTAGSSAPSEYSQVICTVPLGCLAAIDTTGCDLLYSQRMAIRSLHYDASTKIALKFEKRWWEDPEVMGGSTIEGGQSSSDLPIRTCVYPSYGIGTKGAPGVLLASYSWSQDALRLGALAQGKGTAADKLLLELTLDNVSKLHGIPKEKFGPVVDHYAHSWYADENARGAFALFGPGQFGRPSERKEDEETGEPKQGSLFASMKAPAAEGKLHIAGEATSIHHAWVLGSLNSAWRAVYNALAGRDELRTKLKTNWGIPDEETEIHLQLLSELAKSGKL